MVMSLIIVDNRSSIVPKYIKMKMKKSNIEIFGIIKSMSSIISNEIIIILINGINYGFKLNKILLMPPVIMK